jgi:photosystem II stability/assembly factor-like uncharacterized protein/PKD repeat protein
MIKFCAAATLVFSLTFSNTFSQLEKPYDAHKSQLPTWVQLMYSSDPDAGAVTDAYNAYYDGNEFVKSAHTQYYKRWLRELKQAVSSRGEEAYLQRSAALRAERGPTSAWQSIGPWDFDQEAASRSYAPGAAHVYTVEQAASNSNVLYAGTATTGLYRTTDHGQNWVPLTNDLLLTSIRAIEIDFTDEDVVYMGAKNALWKSTDGGANWSIIGDATFNSVSHSISDIVSDPSNNQVLFLASDQGLYRSIDGGANWSQLWTEECQEIEFHPTDNLIVYAIKQLGDKTEFYKSIDGGLTWVLKPTGWPNPIAGDEQKRTEISVTLADPNLVYALATGAANGGSGLYGIYVSTDVGETWTFRCCGAQPAGVPDAATNPNMMAWADDGSDDGGQYYYDLAMDVSPTDANRINVAGVNQWISTDGGFTFTCPTKWSEPDEPGYVHADIHDIRYFGSELWYACDGGIFYSTNEGDSSIRKMFGISGTDFWGFGTGYTDGNVMLGGTYHNGTLLKDNNVYVNDWLCTVGGDNVRGFVNFADSRKVYHDNGGSFLSGDRTVPLTGFGVGQLPNATYTVGVSSELAWDPRSPNIVYSGNGTSLYVSADGGGSFSSVYDFGEDVSSIEVAWTNSDVIYVCTYPGWWDVKHVWRTDDGGATWSDITPSNATLGGEDWVPYDIAVSSSDANILYLARTSQYGDYPDLDGKQVFKTLDGGQNWQNISTATLNGEHPSNIMHHRGTQGGIYIGTRRTVYYINDALADWQLFNTDLPVSTFSTKLVPYYNEQKLRNGTNRSVWEVEFYENVAPSVQISADNLNLTCLNDTVHFYDHSALDLATASWSWTFTGGTPATSTVQNPVVVYPNAGSYDVSLTVTDQYGTSTQAQVAFIEHQNIVTASPVIEDFESFDFLPVAWVVDNPDASYTWQEIDLPEGPDCQPTTAAFVNHFAYNNPTTEDYLITGNYDLTATPHVHLAFDYAYARWGDGYEDGFRVEMSDDCGLNWDVLWDKFGEDLETVLPQTDSWEPLCVDWGRHTIKLPENGPTMNIMFRFVAVNGWGNNFYLDNVNLFSQLDVDELENENLIHVYPNPNNGTFHLKTDVANLNVEIFDSKGKLVYTEGDLQVGNTLISPDLATGVYILKAYNAEATKVERLVITK